MLKLVAQCGKYIKHTTKEYRKTFIAFTAQTLKNIFGYVGLEKKFDWKLNVPLLIVITYNIITEKNIPFLLSH